MLLASRYVRRFVPNPIPNPITRTVAFGFHSKRSAAARARANYFRPINILHTTRARARARKPFDSFGKSVNEIYFNGWHDADR